MQKNSIFVNSIVGDFESSFTDKLTEDEKKDTESLIEDLKKSLEGNDVEDIKDKTAKLNEKAIEYATRIYQEAAQANASSTENEAQEEATEAEFVNK